MLYKVRALVEKFHAFTGSQKVRNAANFMKKSLLDMAMYASLVERMTENQVKDALIQNYKMMLICRAEVEEELREEWGLI